mgnify:CR=1 FL=1
MQATGYLQVAAFSSQAQIPVKGAQISVFDLNGAFLAVRITDESGLISPIEVEVPPMSESLDPEFQGKPFTQVNLRAYKADYELLEVNRVQVFPSTVSVQNLMFVPLSEFPSSYDKLERFEIPPQNL